MKLMTKEIEATIPKLYATENVAEADKVAVVKFFCPWNGWTWFATEYDPKERIFFGLVHGHEREWGYFSLAELESVRGPFGLGIERDLHFRPRKLTAQELP